MKMTPSSDKGKPFISEITLRNILSFGPDTTPLTLERLNVLIGPNGAGKSNLIDVIALLHGIPNDLQKAIRKGGTPEDWVWKGALHEVASISVVTNDSHWIIGNPIIHNIAFRKQGQILIIDREEIQHKMKNTLKSLAKKDINNNMELYIERTNQLVYPNEIINDSSILSQIRDPFNYPNITSLSDFYRRIGLYREWTFGRNALIRIPKKTDMRNDRLEEDLSNLGIFLNRLRRTPKVKNRIIEALHDLYEDIDDFDVSVEGGTVQIFFTEGDFTIPANRLSDGTLRYLSLLAILCDPDPPPLICIEEPELGLHPDILPKIADLLVEASERTQLIVTTHSDIIIDALTEQPESVVVCEKHQGQTVMKRLDKAKLQVWLDNYRLGELWTRGEIGGNRW